jgi:proline dehydrogenase
VSFSTSVLRPLILRVAEHPWSRKVITRTRPGRAVAFRFVAGESLDEAMQVASPLDRRRITSMLDFLGENVRT